MSTPTPPRSRMMAASVTSLIAGILGALITAGVWVQIAPLELWSYPVATLLSLIAIAAAWVARSAGLKIQRAGSAFPGWMSLLGFLLGGGTFVVTAMTTIAFLTSLFR